MKVQFEMPVPSFQLGLRRQQFFTTISNDFSVDHPSAAPQPGKLV
jgi:hypothetical protein